MRVIKIGGRLGACCLAAVVAVSAGWAEAALAHTEATPGQELSYRHKEIARSTIEAHRADPDSRAKRNEARSSLIEQSARSGTLYDQSEVAASAVDDVAVAWSEGTDLDRVIVTEETETDGDVNVAGLGAIGDTSAEGHNPTYAHGQPRTHRRLRPVG